MSNWNRGDIEKLHLEIPASEFPLKSDVIVGYDFPQLIVPVGECEQETVHATKQNGRQIFDLDHQRTYENYGEFHETMSDLCEKYKGTLVSTLTDEEGNTEYYRIRNGVRKKVKVVEE
jgi:hypothetical protein